MPTTARAAIHIEKGAIPESPCGRKIRVCPEIDTRLMFGDVHAKVAAFGADSGEGGQPTIENGKITEEK